MNPSVPNSLGGAVDAVEETAEDVIETVEQVFNPRPGGMIDRHRQEKARREAAAKQAEQAAERVEENASFAVKTAQITPEITSTNVITIAAGGNAQILPLSKYRYRATIIVVTTASVVNLAKDSNAALGSGGFPLPTGIPLVINSRAQLYGANPGGAAVQVAVLSEIYAPETIAP